MTFHFMYCAELRKIPRKMKQETGSKPVTFNDILPKFLDITIMDFCIFRHLKSTLSKRRPIQPYALPDKIPVIL